MIARFFMLLALSAFAASAAADGYIGTEEGVLVVATLLVSIANLLGIILFVSGVYSIYKHGENPNQYPRGKSIATILAGTLLISAASAYAWTVNTGSTVEWASDKSMLAVGQHLDDSLEIDDESLLGRYVPKSTRTALFGFIYLIGLIGFLRGLYLLKDVGQVDNGSKGGFAQAFWHIAGGSMTMNILKVGCFLSWLLGISMLCSGV